MGFGTGFEYVKEIRAIDQTIKAIPEGEFLHIQIKIDDDVIFIPPDENGIFTIKLKPNKVRQLWGLLDIMKPSKKGKVIIKQKEK